MSQPITSRNTTELVYLAFRAAIGLLCRTLNSRSTENGPPVLLEKIPAAQGCAPQVQLQLVLDAWDAFQKGNDDCSSLHHCVVYCCLSELASLAEAGNDLDYEAIHGGPGASNRVDRLWLTSKIRTMQITWPFEIDSAEFLRESGLLTDDLDAIGDHDSPVRELLNVVGAWKIDLRLPDGINELLSPEEIRHVTALMKPHAVLPA